MSHSVDRRRVLTAATWSIPAVSLAAAAPAFAASRTGVQLSAPAGVPLAAGQRSVVNYAVTNFGPGPTPDAVTFVVAMPFNQRGTLLVRDLPAGWGTYRAPATGSLSFASPGPLAEGEVVPITVTYAPEADTSQPGSVADSLLAVLGGRQHTTVLLAPDVTATVTPPPSPMRSSTEYLLTFTVTNRGSLPTSDDITFTAGFNGAQWMTEEEVPTGAELTASSSTSLTYTISRVLEPSESLVFTVRTRPRVSQTGALPGGVSGTAIGGGELYSGNSTHTLVRYYA